MRTSELIAADSSSRYRMGKTRNPASVGRVSSFLRARTQLSAESRELLPATPRVKGLARPATVHTSTEVAGGRVDAGIHECPADHDVDVAVRRLTPVAASAWSRRPKAPFGCSAPDAGLREREGIPKPTLDDLIAARHREHRRHAGGGASRAKTCHDLYCVHPSRREHRVDAAGRAPFRRVGLEPFRARSHSRGAPRLEAVRSDRPLLHCDIRCRRRRSDRWRDRRRRLFVECFLSRWCPRCLLGRRGHPGRHHLLRARDRLEAAARIGGWFSGRHGCRRSA